MNPKTKSASAAADTAAEASAASTEALIREIAGVFPRQNRQQARVARAIYRLLAAADTATVADIAAAAGLTPGQVSEMLVDWPGVYRDDDGDVVGFWGLTGRDMPHRMIFDGRIRHAWCAWDTLFIPDLVGRPAEVLSRTAIDGREVRLAVSGRDIRVLEPAGQDLYVTFRIPGEGGWEKNVIASFCHFVFFVTDAEKDVWLADNPDGVVLSLNNAFRAGLLKNRLQFGSD